MIRVKHLTETLERAEILAAAIDKLLRHLSQNKSRKQFLSYDLAECLKNPYFYIFVAEDTAEKRKKKCVGMGIIYFQRLPTRWVAEIHDVVVKKKHRRRGVGKKIGKRLIKTAEDFSKLQGTEIKLSLTSRPERGTAEFYKKLGFTLIAKANKTGENEGTDLYTMTITP